MLRNSQTSSVVGSTRSLEGSSRWSVLSGNSSADGMLTKGRTSANAYGMLTKGLSIRSGIDNPVTSNRASFGRPKNSRSGADVSYSSNEEQDEVESYIRELRNLSKSHNATMQGKRIDKENINWTKVMEMNIDDDDENQISVNEDVESSKDNVPRNPFLKLPIQHATVTTKASSKKKNSLLGVKSAREYEDDLSASSVLGSNESSPPSASKDCQTSCSKKNPYEISESHSSEFDFKSNVFSIDQLTALSGSPTGDESFIMRSPVTLQSKRSDIDRNSSVIIDSGDDKDDIMESKSPGSVFKFYLNSQGNSQGDTSIDSISIQTDLGTGSVDETILSEHNTVSSEEKSTSHIKVDMEREVSMRENTMYDYSDDFSEEDPVDKSDNYAQEKERILVTLATGRDEDTSSGEGCLKVDACVQTSYYDKRSGHPTMFHHWQNHLDPIPVYFSPETLEGK